MNFLKSFPSRTPIYSLEPINKNSVDIESFHHYVYRLATAHCLNTRTFLYWCITSPGYYYENSHAAAFSIQETQVNALEKLSKRNDLSEMTLLYFREVLSDRNLYRKYQAWCPICLSEKGQSGFQCGYEKLIWTLNEINVCTIHEQTLINKCNSCNKQQLQFVKYGYCRYCMYDLSSIESRKKASLPDLEHSEELINNLINAPRRKEIPVENSINFLMDIHQLEIKNLSNATSIDPITLQRKKLNFNTFFKLSHYFKSPLYMLLDKRLIQEN